MVLFSSLHGSVVGGTAGFAGWFGRVFQEAAMCVPGPKNEIKAWVVKKY
jgi:hypothetical protein